MARRFLNSFLALTLLSCLVSLTAASWSWHHPTAEFHPGKGGRLSYKNPRNAPSDYCPRDDDLAQQQGRTCLRKCTSDEDCKSKRKKCLCDGACGLSCIKPEKECGDPEPPADLGEVHITGKMFGSKAVYSCPTGFRVIGMEERICQADGTWSGNPPACKKNIYCTQPPTIDHARHNAPLEQTTFDLDTSLQYQCFAGYMTKGFARTKCFFYNGTAKWFGPDITCEPRTCGEPPEILNGHREGLCYHFTCKVTYVCQAGFELLGKPDLTCTSDGTWTQTDLPTCVPVQCPIPENPAHGKAVFSSVSFNSYVSYECKYGYMLVGEGTRRCGPNKKWTGVEPACKEINCGSPGILHNGWLEGSRTTLHAVVLFHCLQGTTFEGSSDRSVCQSDGKWSHPLAKCYAPCIVPQVAFGNVTSRPDTVLDGGANETANTIPIVLQPGTGVPHGRVIGVECEKKYEPTYNITPSTCFNGSWTHAPRCQPARCKHLPKAPRNGMVIAPKTEHGMKARFTCRDGYNLAGHNVTECQYGEWIGDPPLCNQTYCKYPGSIPDGKVLLVGNMGLYDYRNYVTKVANNRQITFECSKGFVLADGPLGKTCIRGEWSPKADPPRCIPSQHPNFRWIRRKRRAIKTGGGSIVRNKISGGGGGAGTRRRKKTKTPGVEGEEDYDPSPLACDDLDEDEYIQIQVIEPGEDANSTSSSGTVLKVSCTVGYGVNLPNATVKCVHGSWKPIPPQCDALPCKAPHIYHGSFYNSTVPSKGIYFQEVIKHTKQIDLRCSKGYNLKGPSRMSCWYGEWDVAEPPECIPASCMLPQIEYGNYVNGFRSGVSVPHNTEVDYVCGGDFRKIVHGPARCHLGDWRPNKPLCLHPSIARNYSIAMDPEFEGDKKKKGQQMEFLARNGNGLITLAKKSCDAPPKEKGAIAYAEGKPVDYDNEFSFPDETVVLYKCANAKSKAKNRWKITCEDGTWVGSSLACEGDVPEGLVDDLMKLINASCTFENKEEHVVTFFNNQEVVKENIEFSTNSLLISRCYDIGKFELHGSMWRKCVSGQWLGVKPTCEGLSQANDYALDRPPTILFRFSNGSIVQSNEGELVVYPGTTLHMECIWIRKFGTPKWESNSTNTQRVQKVGWTDGIPGREPTLEYRLSIEDAVVEDSGSYTCTTPSKHAHRIDILVKNVECESLPAHPDLEYSTTATELGTQVTFKCRSGNAVVGAEMIYCTASGNWSNPLPKCENVECADISILPAMAPLAYTAVTKNGTLKRNETAPPKISIVGRYVGGKAHFSCPQGYIIQGSTDATCLNSGEWSSAIPLCKEVECSDPPPPENGYVSGTPPYKAGDMAQIECNQGYMMEGSAQAIVACQDSGKWLRAAGIKCVQACTYPGTIIGGTISQVRFYYKAQETVTFDCTEGYQLVGARMLHCLRNGKWSTSIPTCVPNAKMPSS